MRSFPRQFASQKNPRFDEKKYIQKYNYIKSFEIFKTDFNKGVN